MVVKKHRWKVGQPCHWCRVAMTPPVASEKHLATTATDEHLITQGKFKKLKDPELRKLKDHPDNVVIACFRCNNLRGNISFEIFEEFARVVLRPYPYAPTPFLRASLRQFMDSLAEIGIRNRKESRRALSLALLAFSDMMEK